MLHSALSKFIISTSRGSPLDTKRTSRPTRLLIALISYLLASEAIAAEQTPPRPNIVLILCDDLGYADVGFNAQHFGVQTDVVTPHIDALARQGMIFPQAYVAHPFCGPSRMGLLSGRMPHCFGGQENLPDVARNVRDFNQKGIPESEVLISTVLQESGYRNACIGKWHLGDAKPFHPVTRGFDEFFGFLGGGHQYYPFVTDKVEPKINDYQFFLQRNFEDYRSPEGAYLTDMLSDEAVNFVQHSAGGGKPFFLYLAYNAPHSPLQGKAEDLQTLYPDHKPSNPGNGVDFRDYDPRQNYVAMVYAVDRGVGQLAAALNDPNADGDQTDSIMDETLIVFLSDNGGKILQAGNNAPLLDDKGSTHEGGIRVPMFMHWPGHVPSSSVFDHPVLALDFYPTLAGLAGASIPADKKLDGKYIWTDMLAGRDPHADDTIFWLRHHGAGNEVAIRYGNLKAYRKNFGKWQVFDVKSDVSESSDVARSNMAFLSERVAEGAAWARTHLEPQWHDTETSLQSWNKNNMPRYDETFQSDGPPERKQLANDQCPRPYGDVLADRSGTWELVPTHSDEFEGDVVDTGKWNVDPKDWGAWSWKPSNVHQVNGALELTMRQASHSRGKMTLDYTSGMAKTTNTITYGYFEARVRGCSRYPGACPAFWLYSRGPTNRHQARDGETVSYSEIDIVELQQSEWDFERKQHFQVSHMDCNLHAVLQRDGQDHWVRPHSDPEMCKTAYDASWDPREDYHVYAVLNTPDEIVWFVDGQEIGRKPNLYWHLPMHLTLSLGLRHPFVKYQDGTMVSVPEAKTDEGFPTSMTVDYVRVWQRPEDAKPRAATDWTLSEYVTREKVKWDQNGWPWNQNKVESNFHEIDTNNDGLASGEERQKWFKKKAGESK